jgi:hypothetical protein
MEVHSDPLLGWGRRVSGRLLTVDVPGGHVSMLQEPHVSVLADALQARIDEALAAFEPLHHSGRSAPMADHGAPAGQSARAALETSTAGHLG